MKTERNHFQHFLMIMSLIGFTNSRKLCDLAEKFPFPEKHYDIQSCPINMVLRNCTDVCQRTCEDPGNCLDGACTTVEGCVCPDGFFISGVDCVKQDRCGCYEADSQTVIPEETFHVNTNCTRKGVCTNGTLRWDEGYFCDSNALCDVRDDIRQCYCSRDFIGDGETCRRPKDCQEIYDDGSSENGIYKIKPTEWSDSPFDVYCNMSDGGGWTVFQRREDGSQDFYLGWNSYKEGFGKISHEFWLGNDKLHYLTKQKTYELRIDLVNRNGAPYYAKFDYFRITDESDNYRLTGLGKYIGTADYREYPDGASLKYHLNYQFSTYDRDNDAYIKNCAVMYHGSWWYNACHHSNLNGDYFGPFDSHNSIRWIYLPGSDDNIKYTEMKIRPV